MAKIMWVGDSPTVDTGFGVVSKNIIRELRSYGHEIVVLGINTYGDPYDPREFPYKIYPCQPGGTTEMYGFNKLWPIVDFEKPDILFFLNDPWMIADYMKRKTNDYPYMKTMAYFPTDAGPIKREWIDMLKEFDAQVCYSRFAENVVTDSNGGKRPKNLYQIYHGIDTSVYKPLNQNIVRHEIGLDPSWFIVGMVARNQFRKRFDLLAKAFAEFATDKPDAKLYLHTSLHDVGFDILDLCQQVGLTSDQLILTPGVSAAKGVTEQELNQIYNTFDVNALISLGDGFGLPVAESMAVGCPQLVSDHSCLKELVEGHGGLTVKNAAWILHTSGINTWGGVSDVDDIVAKLNLLYNNRELRIKYSEEAYEFITQEKFTWKYAGNEFNNIIRKITHLL